MQNAFLGPLAFIFLAARLPHQCSSEFQQHGGIAAATNGDGDAQELEMLARAVYGPLEHREPRALRELPEPLQWHLLPHKKPKPRHKKLQLSSVAHGRKQHVQLQGKMHARLRADSAAKVARSFSGRRERVRFQRASTRAKSFSQNQADSAKNVSGMLAEAREMLDEQRSTCLSAEAKASALLETARAALAQDQQRLLRDSLVVTNAAAAERQLDEDSHRLGADYQEHKTRCEQDVSGLQRHMKDLLADYNAVSKVWSTSPCTSWEFLQLSQTSWREREEPPSNGLESKERRSFMMLRGSRQAASPAASTKNNIVETNYRGSEKHSSRPHDTNVNHTADAASLSLKLLELKLRSPSAQHALHLALNHIKQNHADMKQQNAGATAVFHVDALGCSGLGCEDAHRLFPRGCAAPGRSDCQAADEAGILLVAAIQDQQEAARRELARIQSRCEQSSTSFTQELDHLARRREMLQVATSAALARRYSGEEATRLKRKQLVQANLEVKKTRDGCTASIQALEDRACQLDSLRAELFLAATPPQEVPDDVTDCEVTAWIAETCTATCGGGTQKFTRRVIKPSGSLGAVCPKLEETRPCATAPCPVDCMISDWTEWSPCTAACGSGTRTRTRSIEQQASGGGLPCPEENSVNDQCSIRPCDTSECELGIWSHWSTCSRACGGGLKFRTRSPLHPEFCPAPQAPEHEWLEYSQCNGQACPSTATQQALQCNAKIDLAIVLDGSGACGVEGFEQTKTFIQALLNSLNLGPDTAQVALTVAGGMQSWDAYANCMSGSSLADCNVRIALKLTPDLATASDAVTQLPWPGGPGHLAGALAFAGSALLEGGRRDASSLVLVITRGRPLSTARTADAAEALRSRGQRVSWLLLGEDAPKEEAVRWASLPTRDNVLLLASQLGAAPGSSSSPGAAAAESGQISQVVATICPAVELAP